MREDVASKVEEIANRIVQSEGLELVEAEVKGDGNSRFVRITIDKIATVDKAIDKTDDTSDDRAGDKIEGVTHADCQLVSDKVGEALEAEDAIPGHYTLEVSSPGLERKLLKPQDYQRFQGKKAMITVRNEVDGRRTWEGTLAGYADGMISLETQPGETRRLPFEQVKKANLKFEW